jgi:hypothetical protein
MIGEKNIIYSISPITPATENPGLSCGNHLYISIACGKNKLKQNT